MPLLTSLKAKDSIAGRKRDLGKRGLDKRGLGLCQIGRPKSAIQSEIWIISKAGL
jgi:hypothetical protein